jgi:hypothetical protein
LFYSEPSAAGGLLNPPFTLGWDFTANDAITVDALGVFDSGQVGLTDSYEVGLWDSAGDLLAETTVSSGTADPLVNQWRYAAITPVTLVTGDTYYLGALYLTSDDNLIFPGVDSGTVTTTTNITFGQATYAGGSSLSDPTTGFPTAGPGFFGPNIAIAGGIPEGVPEPATWAMMLLGFAGLGYASYRSSRRARSDALA